MCGVGMRTVQRIEAGNYKPPLKTLKTIAAELNISGQIIGF